MGEPILSPLRQNWGNRSSLRRAEQPYDATKSREENRVPLGDASVCLSPLPQQRRRTQLLWSPPYERPTSAIGNSLSPMVSGVRICDQPRSGWV